MFTGIITDVGEIAKIEKIEDMRAKIFCKYDVSEIDLGASICCDGVCLTVTDCGTEKTKNWFSVDISSPGEPRGAPGRPGVPWGAIFPTGDSF